MAQKCQSPFPKTIAMLCKYKVCVIDDEEDIRSHLVEAINESEEFEVIGEIGDFHGAVEMISTLEPDAIFLDIKILEGNAFQVIKSLKQNGIKLPAIILNTGFTDFEYAEKAINEHKDCVIKLLRKPFWENWNETKHEITLAIGLHQKKYATNQVQYSQKIKIRSKNNIWFVAFEDILYIQIPEVLKGKGKIEVITKNQTLHVNKTLSQIAYELPNEFLRVSRYAVINKNYLTKVDRDDYIAVLSSGHQVGIGQNYLKKILEN